MARLGGDEFAVVLPDIGGLDEARRVATKLLSAFDAPFDVDGLTIRIDASVGITVAPLHGDDSTTLLQRADVAMYRAKATATSTAVFEDHPDNDQRHRLGLLVDEARKLLQWRGSEYYGRYHHFLGHGALGAIVVAGGLAYFARQRWRVLLLAAILPLSAAAQDYVRNIPGPFSPVFQEVIKEPAKCTVQIYLNGDRAALGAIVRSDGYIVTNTAFAYFTNQVVGSGTGRRNCGVFYQGVTKCGCGRPGKRQSIGAGMQYNSIGKANGRVGSCIQRNMIHHPYLYRVCVDAAIFV